MDDSNSRNKIINLLATKSVNKYKVYDNTLDTFKRIKVILREFADDIKEELHDELNKIPIEYTERNKYEVELKVAGDLLVFTMHSNIFQFPKAHAVMQSGYIKNDNLKSYCGTISIYNFLADSFKYNRVNDIGYLVGRIFINNENHFIVEGKKQLGFLFNNFANQKTEDKNLIKIIESALQYAIEFDLLIPPYEQVKFVSVQEMNQITSSISLKTGKRLGFRYKAGDVTIE